MDESTRTVRMHVVFNSKSVASGNSNYESTTQYIPSKYLPKKGFIKPLERSGKILLYCWSGGTTGISNITSGTLSNFSCDVQIEYTY